MAGTLQQPLEAQAGPQQEVLEEPPQHCKAAQAGPLQYPQASPARGMPLGAALRFIGRHLCRFSLFALLAGVGFLCASCWLWRAIQSGEREAERLYLSTPVEAEITKKNTAMTVSGSGAFIGQKAVQDILETGFVEECTLIAGGEGYAKGMGMRYRRGRQHLRGLWMRRNACPK